MNQVEAKAILLNAFSTLNDEQVSNFEHHLRRETRVLAGPVGTLNFYCHGAG